MVFNGLAFFRGQLEVAVLFHFAPGGLPPFFIIVLVDHIRHEHFLHFFAGGQIAVAVDDHLDHLIMMQCSQLLEAFHFGGFTRLDVLLGNGRENLGRKGEINRVPGPTREVHRHFPQHHIHRFDLTESPALVRAKPLGCHPHKGVNIPGANFPCGGHLFKFFFHESLDTAPPARKGSRDRKCAAIIAACRGKNQGKSPFAFCAHGPTNLFPPGLSSAKLSRNSPGPIAACARNWCWASSAGLPRSIG